MGGSGPVGVAVIGAGVISEQYLTTLTALPDLRVHVVADRRAEAAAARANQFGVASHGDVATALEHPEVELVVNLTIPAAHVEVGLQAIEAGKHVWNEKPLATERDEARALLGAAAVAGVRVGGAPDTFLGPGLQTALRLIEDGRIGRPLSGIFMMQTPGPERWHPNPDFLYAPGGGPLFDLGPYYLATLVQVLGPVTEVAAIGSQACSHRVIGGGSRAGERLEVHVPTQVSVLLKFEDGGSAQGVISFDSPHPRAGFVEVTGSDATLSLPDPNKFEGEIGVWPAGATEWETTVVDRAKARRGLGVLDMARAIRAGVPHRATGELAYHVLDTMCAIDEAIETGTFVPVRSRAVPAPTVPDVWDPYAATL